MLFRTLNETMALDDGLESYFMFGEPDKFRHHPRANSPNTHQKLATIICQWHTLAVDKTMTNSPVPCAKQYNNPGIENSSCKGFISWVNMGDILENARPGCEISLYIGFIVWILNSTYVSLPFRRKMVCWTWAPSSRWHSASFQFWIHVLISVCLSWSISKNSFYCRGSNRPGLSCSHKATYHESLSKLRGLLEFASPFSWCSLP